MHWHISKTDHKDARRVPGEVGECCEPYATWQDLFGGPDESRQTPEEDPDD